MSEHDGTNITTFPASDDTDQTPRTRRGQRRYEIRRDRHEAHRTLRGYEQTPIRRLLKASA